ncbi:hypothetical protein [[Clostridium] fimetarium]|uniref:Uncharacterized protein n=1 Tax=[Clostridium] fimetarium TaxID=99656 RepID=A0A1I0QVS6_9FIRM|nr:hypothetical protein [[Clostridium] fimetarium]SEW31772.1 hypothetical protein SAMN05421659_109181 [[Clostridium] fimetarium]
MRDFLRYDYEVSKKRLIPAFVIFIIAVLYSLFTGVAQNIDFFSATLGLIGIGLLVGGLIYSWRVAAGIMKPGGYNEYTNETFYYGGISGAALQFGLGIVLGCMLGGILFAIDILRTIIFIIYSKKTANKEYLN